MKTNCTASQEERRNAMVLRLSSLANRPSATLLHRSLTFIVMPSMFISNCRPTGIDNAHDTTVRLHEKVDGRVVVICGPTPVCIHFISIWFSVRSWTMQQSTFFLFSSQGGPSLSHPAGSHLNI